MSGRVREIVRGVPLRELAEDAIGAALLFVLVWHLPRLMAVAAVLLEGAR